MRKLIRTILFLFILITSLSFQASLFQIHIPQLKPPEKDMQLQRNNTQKAIQDLGALPLYFVENKGQLDSLVKYHVKIPNANVYLTSKEVVYQFIHRKCEENIHKDQFMLREKDQNEKTIVDNMRVSFKGANQEVKVEGLEENRATFSYFRGNDPERWVQGARTYSKVIYKELYPEMDLIVRGEEGRIKHEYIVRPGGEIEDIQIRYDGVKGLRMNEEGELEILLKGGKLNEGNPVSYQIIDGERVEVQSGYRVLKDNVIGFSIGEYKTDSELIIDPVIFYSTFIGGSSHDYGHGIAIDRSGNAYITGQTHSLDFPTTSGAYDRSFGNIDVFITKLNSTGSSLVYSTYLGGSSWEEGSDIAIDGSGNAYVTGHTYSSDFPTTLGAYDTGYSGKLDVFITKFNSTGSDLSFSTYLGGTEDDYSHSIDLGVIVQYPYFFYVSYITGSTKSTDFPTTLFAFDQSHNGKIDAFITKLDHIGSALYYSTYLGGSESDEGYGIAVDGSGNAYVTGHTYSSNFPTTSGAYDTGYNGELDVFITKFNSTGSALSYSTFLGGSFEDIGQGIEVDQNGYAYITGYTGSTDFPTSSGAYDTSLNGNDHDQDVFITKLNSTGSALSYSTYLGGSSSDHGHGIAIDGSGNAYVTGDTYSSDFPTTLGAYDTSHNGLADVFISKFNLKGTALSYSTYLGGSSEEDEDVGEKIAVDESGNAYVIGVAVSPDFPTTSGAYDTIYNGNNDAFIAKIPCQQHLPIFDGHDFNGDGKSDASVFRPSNGRWYLKGIGSYTWGTTGDIPVNGDYNGDGKTDVAVWRPSNGRWYLRGIGGVAWGTSGDTPVPGNYNGDINETTDIAVWRPSNGHWYIKSVGSYVWGTTGDIPVPGDYNGDGKTDIAVWRPSNGSWYIRGVGGYVWGTAGDIPVPADYNGDGVTDIAVWRPSNGKWYIRGIGGASWGAAGDIPAPGDYNSDGIIDIAVWRPSNGRWYIKGLGGYIWGIIGDIPLVR